jgi:hypothetical protein
VNVDEEVGECMYSVRPWHTSDVTLYSIPTISPMF